MDRKTQLFLLHDFGMQHFVKVPWENWEIFFAWSTLDKVLVARSSSRQQNAFDFETPK